jgi:tetratricopeptide (TPR) repeat protein
MNGPTPAIERLEAEAERALRRGELKEALRLYHQVLAASPDSPAVRTRIASIESLVQPSELAERPLDQAPQRSARERPPTPEQTAEMLFERGDYQGALAAYERILAARPDHQLARERHAEIGQLISLNPRSSAPPSLPDDKEGLLEALLVRIASRRKA